MRSFTKWILSLTACCWPGVTGAHLEVATNPGPQRVFSGAARSISVVFHNPDSRSVESEIRTRTYQASSATVVLLSEKPWKKLQVLPGQTVLETTPFDFPTVKAETKFLVQWLEGANRVIGRTEVLVYPTNLLAELKPLGGDRPVGLYDPQNQIKPLLKGLAVEFEDLAETGLDGFSGKLAIIGPFQSKAQMREGLADQIQALAKKNTAIVWFQPPPEKRDKLQPSFYSVMEKQIAVVIVQPDLITDLPENPKSQLNLIYFCQLALHPQPLILPDLSPHP